MRIKLKREKGFISILGNGIKSQEKGFTLIELLVVVAIIGILAGTILFSLLSARARGRDARRTADIKALQSAIELYRDSAGGRAPETLVCLTGGAAAPCDKEYIAEIPTDPFNEASSGFIYPYARGGTTIPGSLKYYIQFQTETDTPLGDKGYFCATGVDITPRAGTTCVAK